jgi:hypothetical protein
MATPFMGQNHRSGSPTLKRYINANPTSVGAITGASADNNGGFGTPSQFCNRSTAVQFGGSNRLVDIQGDKVFLSTDGGSSWTEQTSGTTAMNSLISSIQSMKSGLHILYNNGVPELTCIYRSGSNTFYAAYSTDGVNWTKSSSFTANGGGISTGWVPFTDEVIWDNKLVLLTSDGAGGNYFISITYDPATHTFSQANSANLGGVSNSSALCVFNSNCYILGMHGTGLGSASHKISIFQISGSSLVNVINVETGNTIAAPDEQCRFSMFVDGTSMYALYWKSTGLGWRCQQLNSSLSPTDVTSAVIPAGMSSGTASTNRTGIIVDNPTPGVAPDIYIFFAADGGTSTVWSMYEWNGSATVMSGVGSPGGLASDSMPFYKDCQGATFWTANERHVEITARAFVSGGIQFSFKLYSSSGSETVVARFWYGGPNDEYPVNDCTLSSASAGSIAGNAISGLTANGTTVYTVVWNASTDGINPGDIVKVAVESSDS